MTVLLILIILLLLLTLIWVLIRKFIKWVITPVEYKTHVKEVKISEVNKKK